MIDMRCEECTQIRARVTGHHRVGTNVRMVQLDVYCGKCGFPFRSLGCHPGMSFEEPWTENDGFTTLVPVVPEGEEPWVKTPTLS